MAIVPASARELGFRDVVFRPLWTADAWAEIDLVWNDDQRNPAVDRFRDFVLTHLATAARK